MPENFHYRNVAMFNVHPKYKKTSFGFDIAVIKTVTPFIMTNVTSTIKLANVGYNPRGKFQKQKSTLQLLIYQSL